ncbi:MAG: polyhydroxyalkanoate synthesis repressor PhaR [Ahrensia sp.]|nr:polyhydroxyalkanoate synthesis repressor PhaR [Ahrensia sp.]
MAKSTRHNTGAEETDAALPVVIKKYPNRRLYNTATSSYIVQKDIEAMVRDGTAFTVEDAKTGEDITRSILNQIIFEQETKPSNYHFPLEFQKQLIAMYGDGASNLVPNYLTESLKLFANERAKMTESMNSAVSRNTQAMLDYTRALARQNMELFQRSWDMFGMMAGARPSSKPSDHDDEQSRKEELEEIQKTIAKLQKRVEELK